MRRFHLFHAKHRDTIRNKTSGDVERQQERKMEFVKELKTMPIALATKEANQQHYEVSPRCVPPCASHA